jgi:hypothetical protein
MAITGTTEYGRIFGYEPYHAEWNFERVPDHVVPEDRAFVETYSRGVIELANIRSVLEQEGS